MESNDKGMAKGETKPSVKPYIVIVQDQEISVREYVTIALSEEDAVKNIENGMYIIESEPTVVDNLRSEAVRVERLDEGFIERTDAGYYAIAYTLGPITEGVEDES